MKKILAKQREKEENHEKQLKKKEDAVNSLASLVVRAWLSEEEAKAEILIVNEEKRKAVLQAQLAFFRNIPNITCIAGLFNKAKLVGIRRVGLSWQELFENFVKVLKSFRSFQNQMEVEAKIINPDERKVTVEHQKKKIMDKISNVSLGQLNKLQVNSMIMKFIENPELVVGMSIEHRVKENNSVETS